ncbi:hypothetical protein GLYMA_17G095900v4 [Glycine max]|uniref:Uncharacterized protein n=2 Tax=Glycine subgen. Soja TaxID=1462606 RepID=K7MKT7_SOYBN|nr:hypothetical protein GYH30_046781 [Glycine max]KAH1201702.1 hypothetical protein GmHk_17G048331 [Glycine max]KRH03405.1 hypothetical protein GLYMA_17G095900v4 [Glycine max]RZB56093.1 hypothetical protein D0Y65_045362 [Glycine soja]
MVDTARTPPNIRSSNVKQIKENFTSVHPRPSVSTDSKSIRNTYTTMVGILGRTRRFDVISKLQEQIVSHTVHC